MIRFHSTMTWKNLPFRFDIFHFVIFFSQCQSRYHKSIFYYTGIIFAWSFFPISEEGKMSLLQEWRNDKLWRHFLFCHSTSLMNAEFLSKNSDVWWLWVTSVRRQKNNVVDGLLTWNLYISCFTPLGLVWAKNLKIAKIGLSNFWL